MSQLKVKWHPPLHFSSSSQSSSFSSLFSQLKLFHNLINVKQQQILAPIKTKQRVLKSLPFSRSSLRASSAFAPRSSLNPSRCCILIETRSSSLKPLHLASFSPPVSCMFCLILSICFGLIVSRKTRGISFPFRVFLP